MWQKLQLREKNMLVLLVVIGFIFFFYKLVFISQLQYLIEMGTKLDDVRSKAGAAEQVAGSLRQEIEFSGKAGEQLDDIRPLFSSEMSDGLALVRLGMEAANANIEVLSYIPSPVVDKDFYVELPVRMAVRGFYPDVANFIAWLEKQSNLSEIRALRVELPAGSRPGAFQAGGSGRQAGDEGQQVSDSTGGSDRNVPDKFSDGVGAWMSGMTGKQSGMPLSEVVLASFDLVVYSLPSPAEKLKVQQVTEWSQGRANPFLAVDSIIPQPGVKAPGRVIEDHAAGNP